MKTPESILRNERPTDGIEVAARAFRTPSPSHQGVGGGKWPALAGLATALGVGFAALRITTTPAEASPLARIVEAERNAPRCTLTIQNQTGNVWLRAWQEEAKNAMQTYSTSDRWTTHTGFDGKRMWVVVGDGRLAIVQSELTPFRAPLLQKIGDYKGKVVGTSTGADGTKTVTVERTASATSIRQRDVIVADRQDRPVSVTHQLFDHGWWSFAGREVRDYDSPIPVETFAFRPPSGYEVYDIDANRALLREGLKSGPRQAVENVSVRLAGVLQDRSGTLTVAYTGGSTPLPDAKARVVWNGNPYSGSAVVGQAPDPRAGKSIGVGGFRFPGRTFPMPKDTIVQATPEPYMNLDGIAIRLLRFKLPKILGNAARRIQVTLPVVREGKTRTVGRVQGRGIAVGTATFEVRTIPSNGGEEIFRLPNVKRAAYEIPLAIPKG